MTKITVEEFRNFFKYYKDEEQQRHGVEDLYMHVDADLLTDSAEWIKLYRGEGIGKSEVPELEDGRLLKVPYQSQLDNASGTGYRECFSSSCAMVAMYYGKVPNDDEYNLVRAKYGDSTDAAAQVAALKELGLEARFITNGTTDDLRKQINSGRPVPVGWLHKGSVDAPSGGGHWSVVIGYKPGTWIVNDPNGEANLVPGGYAPNKDGSNQQYSYKNFNPRWIVGGEGDGWYLDIRDPAKKVETTDNEPSTTSRKGIELIKEFEGCVLKAYPDPGTGGDPWTIGYGHTGPDVRPGTQITKDRAEELLIGDLKRFEISVVALVNVPLTQREFDAIVSFTYNVGTGSLEHSTFLRRINAGEDKATCFREEFPRWNKGGNGPMPGLTRRREAEVKLALS